MRRTAVLLLLALGVPALADGPPAGPAGAPPAQPPAPVEVAEAVLRPLPASRTFVGTVEPLRRSLVGSEFAGLVVGFLVREGDPVEAGQPLAALRTDLLAIRIEAAEAELDGRRQRLLELENGSRPEEIARERARVAQLDADVELRRWRLEAAELLYEQNTISEGEFRDTRLAVRASELLLAAQEAALALVEAGPRAEQVEQARAAVRVQEAEVRRLQDEKERYVIRAPFAGFVVAEHTEVGEWLVAGAPVAEVVALDEVDVVVQVVEDYVGTLAEGQPARVQIDALGDRILVGTVAQVVPSADERARTFPVKIRLANRRAGKTVEIKAGMFATATLGIGDAAPGLLVPKDAIVLGGPSPIVWAVDPETSTVMPVPVQLGVATEALVQVLGPLAPGAKVVTRGNERLRPGQPVQALPPR